MLERLTLIIKTTVQTLVSWLFCTLCSLVV